MSLDDVLKNWMRRKPDSADLELLLKPRLDDALKEQHAATILSQRNKLDQRDQIIDQRDRIMPGLETAEKTTGENLKDCLDASERAKQVHVSAKLERLGTALEYGRQVEAIDSEIMALAPAIIDEAISEFFKEIQRINLNVRVREGKSEPNWLGVATAIYVSNVASSETRIKAIRAAIDYARSLKLKPLPVEEIVELLKVAVQKLPEVVDQEFEIDNFYSEAWRPVMT